MFTNSGSGKASDREQEEPNTNPKGKSIRNLYSSEREQEGGGGERGGEGLGRQGVGRGDAWAVGKRKFGGKI